jgi:cell division transport system permease protein
MAKSDEDPKPGAGLSEVFHRAMAEAGLDATVDDHSLWRGEVERSAGLITLLAAAAFLLTAGAAGAAVAYATRAGMAAQSAVVDTLSLNGASDATIAGLFQVRYGLLAAGAGAVGAVVAMGLVGALRFLGGAEGVTPALPLAWGDLLILSPCPLLAATVAVVVARVTALARLKRGH